MLALLLFNPYLRLQRQIKQCADGVKDHFDEVGDSYERDQDADGAVDNGKPISHPMVKLMEAALMFGFVDASRLTGKDVALYQTKFRTMAQQRADEVADQMNATTVKMLKQQGTKNPVAGVPTLPQDAHVLSEARATAASRYEATRAYYDGVQQSFAGTPGFGKEWITTGDDPCEECLDNEDEGVIPMEEMFQSGDFAPLAHLNCACILGIKRM